MAQKTSNAGPEDLPHGIGKPATRALASVGITRLTQLTKKSEGELAALHGVGPKALGLLREALRKKGKTFVKDD